MKNRSRDFEKCPRMAMTANVMPASVEGGALVQAQMQSRVATRASHTRKVAVRVADKDAGGVGVVHEQPPRDGEEGNGEMRREEMRRRCARAHPQLVQVGRQDGDADDEALAGLECVDASVDVDGLQAGAVCAFDRGGAARRHRGGSTHVCGKDGEHAHVDVVEEACETAASRRLRHMNSSTITMDLIP